MPFYVYIVLGVVGVIFLWVFIYENFFKDNSATSNVVQTRKADDTTALKKVLNRGAIGEPLIMYAPVKTSKLEKDPYRLELPVYTVSCQNRGLVVGVSGSGKTNFILAQILDWLKSGKSFVCSDVKPEIWGILATNGVLDAFGYESIIINPTDENAHKYNIFDDLQSDNDLDELLQVLLPTQSSETAVFTNVGRLILKAIILFVRDSNDGYVSLTSVYDFIVSQSSDKKMLAKLKDDGSPKVKELMNLAEKIGGNERLQSAGMNTIIEMFQFMSNDTIRHNLSCSDFSLADVLTSEKKAIFLQFEQKAKNTTERLFSVHVQHLIGLLVATAESGKRQDDVFVILDELLNGGKIANLAEKLNLIRDYKAPTFLYIQTIAGLERKYGDESDEIIASSNLKICYRVNDNKTAQEFSKLVGVVSAKEYNKSVKPTVRDNGRLVYDNTHSVNNIELDLVTPEMLAQLPFGKALCIYLGQSAIIDIPQHFKDTPMTEKAQFVRPSDLNHLNHDSDNDEIGG